MASLNIKAEEIAVQKTYSYLIFAKSSGMLHRCNFADEYKVGELVKSILGRLTSGYTETIMCDVLTMFDLHTIMNLPALDSEVQAKMLALLVRYFKIKHDNARLEVDLEIVVENRLIPEVDILLGFYLDYYGPRYGRIDRKIAITEGVMQTMGSIILSCVNHEENFFERRVDLRKVANQICSVMEH